MQPDKKRLKQILAISGGLLAVCGLLWLISRDGPPASADPGYYTGVRFNVRNGLWVDADGKVVPPPPGETAGQTVRPIKTEADEPPSSEAKPK